MKILAFILINSNRNQHNYSRIFGFVWREGRVSICEKKEREKECLFLEKTRDCSFVIVATP